jgi:hypothetical protein
VPKAERSFDNNNNNGNIVNVLDAKMAIAPITSSRKPYSMVLFDISSAGLVMMMILRHCPYQERHQEAR